MKSKTTPARVRPHLFWRLLRSGPLWCIACLFLAFGLSTLLPGQLACAQDFAAQFQHARSLQLGDGGSPDIPAAASLYRSLAESSGTPYVRRAQLELGNLVLDGKYTSGQPALDLFWARSIAQELLGQQQIPLAFSSFGSSMDLPASPEVTTFTIQMAAAYNVDMALRQLAETLAFPESAAWLRLSGGSFNELAARADSQDRGFNPEQRGLVAEAYTDLLAVRAKTGAFYRKGDPLIDPGASTLEALLRQSLDPDAQLRLAFYYEAKASDPLFARKAMDLYRTVRDERVGSVRLKIATSYLAGSNGFPRNPALAAQWFSFAAKAGSKEACTHLREFRAGNVLASKEATSLLGSCPP